MIKVTVCGILAVAISLAGSTASATRINLPLLKKAFREMERALKQGKEPLFARQWDPRGYGKNLIGGSGIPGKAIFRQGSRKGWMLKPDLKKARFLPGALAGPMIVPCQVWSHRKGRAVDEVFALVVRGKSRYLLLGAGEKRDQVIALAKRYSAKEALLPPKRPRLSR